MRVTPTQEQMAYLASIGASKSTIPQPGPLFSECPKAAALTSSGTSKRALQWWVIILVIMALLLSLAGIARAEQEAPPVNAVSGGDQVASQDISTTMAQRITAIEKELTKMKEAGERGDLREQVASTQRRIKSVEDSLKAIHDKLRVALSSDRELISGKLQSVEATINQPKSSIAVMSTEYRQWKTEVEGRIKASKEQVDAQVADAGRMGSRLLDSEVAVLREELEAQRQGLRQALVWFGAIAVLGIGLLIIGRILMEKRIRQVEQSAISRLSETAAISGDNGKSLPTFGNGKEAINKPGMANTVTIAPTRTQPRPLPTSFQQMEEIIASAGRLGHIRVKPTLPSGNWGIGLATNKGNVRSENQDYGLCFKIDGHDVLIVADGCGGVPHGQRAAYLAAVSAAVSVVRAYGMTRRWRSPHVKDVAARAIMDAAHRLAVEGDKLNITDVRGGLRTTLIVVVGNKREVGFAYIGDGGGCVVRSNGDVNRFLDPQKAGDFAMNVLAASLGPLMEGEPVSGVMKREAGDLLIVGTDGVFDRVETTFPKDVLRGCIQYKGNLQKTAEHIVDELASFKDAAGFICDDNLTLGIMGDGTNPKLSQCFWSLTDETQTSAPESSSTINAAQLKEGVS